MLRTLRLAVALAACSIYSNGLFAQNAAINATGLAGAASAILDVDASSALFTPKRGVLIPRVVYAQRPPAPADGLWIYQTDDAVNNPHGFWYYDAGIAAWVHMPYGVGWNLTGNALTTGGTHFLGTADNDTLNFRTSNVQRMTILNTGQIGINTTTPVEALEVNGAVRTYNTASNNLSATAGVIRFNTTPPAGTTNQYHEGHTGTAWERLENAERRVINAPYAGTTNLCGNGIALATPTIAQPPANPALTPFPTGPGRCAKVQYLFLASELTAYGLCTGNVTKIEFRVLQDDPLTPANSLIYECTMKATAAASLGAFDLSVSTASPNYISPALVIGQGWLVSDFTTLGSTPFFWDGVSNVIIEICWTRNTATGNSPQVELTTNFPNCTRYAYNSFANVGCDITDALPAAGTTWGNENRRPVVRFTGQALGPVPVPANWDYINYDGGLMIGTPAWATTPGNFKGPGVICAEVAVFDGTAQLSDHVFDRYFDGNVALEDRSASSVASYNYVELDAMKDFLKEHRRLPNLPSREQWSTTGPLSLGELGTRLWQTVEDQALYIVDMEKDITALEGQVFKAGMTDEELNATIQDIQENTRLTSAERAQLVSTLKKTQASTTTAR